MIKIKSFYLVLFLNLVLLSCINGPAYPATEGDKRVNSTTERPEVYKNNRWQTDWPALANGTAGTSTFIGLSDTIPNYTAKAGQGLRINAAGDGVESYDLPVIVGYKYFPDYITANTQQIKPNEAFTIGDYNAGNDVGTWVNYGSTTVTFSTALNDIRPVGKSSTSIKDDLTPWDATETDIPQGALRKIVSDPVLVFGRIVDDATADGGSSPSSAKWKDITSQLSEDVTIIDSDTVTGTYFAVLGDKKRYIVNGSNDITILFPTAGGVNAFKDAVIYNNGTAKVTTGGKDIPAGGGAHITSDGASFNIVTIFSDGVQSETADIGDVEFLIKEYRPTTGSEQFPADQAGEIRGTGSTYTINQDLTNAEKVVITYQERTGFRRQFTQDIDLKAPFNDGLIKGLESPYDAQHVNSRILDITTGKFYFTEHAINANLVSIKVYGKKELPAVIKPDETTVDKTGLVAGDTLKWDGTKLVKADAVSNTKEFLGIFPLGSANQHFVPNVSGSYRITERIIRATNHELFTNITVESSSASIYSSNSSRLTSSNQSNTAIVTLTAGAIYRIDPVGGGGTSVGTHSVEIVKN